MTTTLPNKLWNSTETARYLGVKQNRLILLAGKGMVPGSYKAGLAHTRIGASMPIRFVSLN